MMRVTVGQWPPFSKGGLGKIILIQNIWWEIHFIT